MKNVQLRRSVLFTFLASVVALGAACDPKTEAPNKPVSPSPTASPSPAASPAVSPAEPGKGAAQLVGRWSAPAGGYLAVTEKTAASKDAPKRFDIEIKTLDKVEKFEGTAKGDVIEFSRNGKTESIKAASGIDTGIKGFEKETSCVVVTKGSEAFCKSTK